MKTFDADNADRSAELESRLDRDESREGYRASLRRVATSPAEQLERIALKCSAAFVKADEDHPDYDTTAEREMDVQP